MQCSFRKSLSKRSAGNAASYLIATLAIISLSMSMLSFVSPGKISQFNESIKTATVLDDVADNHLDALENHIQQNSTSFFKITSDGRHPGWGNQLLFDSKLKLKPFIVPNPPTGNAESVINTLPSNLKTVTENKLLNGKRYTIESIIEFDNRTDKHLYGLKRFITNTQDKAILATVRTKNLSTGQTIRKSKLIVLNDDAQCSNSDSFSSPPKKDIKAINDDGNYIPGRLSGNYFQLGGQNICYAAYGGTSNDISCPLDKSYLPGNYKYIYLVSATKHIVPGLNDTMWVYTTLQVDPDTTNSGANPRGDIVTSISFTTNTSMNTGIRKNIYGNPTTANPANDFGYVTPLPVEFLNPELGNKVVGKYIKSKIIPSKSANTPSFHVVMFEQSNAISSIHTSWKLDMNQKKVVLTRDPTLNLEFSRIRPVVATNGFAAGKMLTITTANAANGIPANHTGRERKIAFNPATDAWDFNEQSDLLTIATIAPQKAYSGHNPTDITFTEDISGPNIITLELRAYDKNDFANSRSGYVHHGSPFDPPSPFLGPLKTVQTSPSYGTITAKMSDKIQMSSTLEQNKSTITRFNQIISPSHRRGTVVFSALYDASSKEGIFAYKPGFHVEDSQYTATTHNTQLLMGDISITGGKRSNITFLPRKGKFYWLLSLSGGGFGPASYIYRWDPNMWGYKLTSDYTTATGRKITGTMLGGLKQVARISENNGTNLPIWNDVASSETIEFLELDGNRFALRGNSRAFIVSDSGYDVFSSTRPSTLSSYGNSMQYFAPNLYYTVESGGRIDLSRYNLNTRAVSLLNSQNLVGNKKGSGALIAADTYQKLYMLMTTNATISDETASKASLYEYTPTCRVRESIAGELEGFSSNGIAPNTVQWSDGGSMYAITPARGDRL